MKAHRLEQTHLNEGDLGSQGSVDIREFQSNVATADDGNPVWDPVQLECMV